MQRCLLILEIFMKRMVNLGVLLNITKFSYSNSTDTSPSITFVEIKLG